MKTLAALVLPALLLILPVEAQQTTGSFTAAAGSPGSGTVTSVTAGTGLSGGTITTTGTVSLNTANTNTWTATQSGCTTTLSISTTTFTLDGTCNNYLIVLTSACASAACTLANFSVVPVTGTSGVIKVVQPSSGGPAAFGTYGSQYESSGGTSTITYSTAANAIDIWAWWSDGTHVFLLPSLTFSH